MNNLTVFNTEVIPAYSTDAGEKVVIGRDLHNKLGIKANYREWFPRMAEYGFEENVDYYSYVEKSTKPQNGGRPMKSHILNLDMAKHIAMIQRTVQGKKIRQKLINLEKVVNADDEIMRNNVFNFGFESDLPLSETNKFMKCAEIMSGCLESNKKYVVNILKNIIPNLDDSQEGDFKIRNGTTDYINATEVGKSFGVSARVLNVILEEQGMQYKNQLGCWTLTDFGKTYGIEISYNSKRHYGMNVRWRPEVVDYLKLQQVL